VPGSLLSLKLGWDDGNDLFYLKYLLSRPTALQYRFLCCAQIATFPLPGLKLGWNDGWVVLFEIDNNKCIIGIYYQPIKICPVVYITTTYNRLK